MTTASDVRMEERLERVFRQCFIPFLSAFSLSVVLTGCGTVPVPKHPGAAPTTTAAEPAPAPAVETQPVPPPTVGAKPVPAVPKERPLVEAKTPREHVQTAVSLLEHGDESRAQAELEAALRSDPENRMAKNLMAQIQADPVKFFDGQESFDYTVQSGESLSIISKRYLDDALKFHILAKYNNINDPSRLVPGQTIRIPGKKPPEPTPAAQASRYAQAKRFYDAGKYQDAIEWLEGSKLEAAEERDLLVLSYTKYADELAKKADLLEAQSVLEKAVTIQPGNQKLKQQLKQVENKREATQLYKQGTDALAAGDKDKAIEAFNQSLKLDPAHEGARNQLMSLKGDAIESMHKEAMVEYRKQNLDKAISLWDSVLAMDPNHELAKLYRARAVELKEKLEKLEKK